MTRKTLRRKLRWITLSLLAVLVVGLLAKLVGSESFPRLDPGYVKFANAFYDLLKDMAVVIVTIAAAYLAAILQRRSKFIESLEEEWRNIVRTKSRLFAYCESDVPTRQAYLEAFCCISEAIDTMRIVYRNVGETDGLVGLYPYVPLQDMRRALQTLDPDRLPPGEAEFPLVQRKIVRDAILQSFYALREDFLEELDLEEPESPLLIAATLRTKRSGATLMARAEQERQARLQSRLARYSSEVDALLRREWDREHQKTRERASPAAGRMSGTAGRSQPATTGRIDSTSKRC